MTDQLTRLERIRLESLSQAIKFAATTTTTYYVGLATLKETLDNAEKIERWIKNDE